MKEPKPTCQEKLEHLQQEFDEFTYIVSHDLKAPLRAIGNLSGWIQEDLADALDPEVKNNLHLLQNRADRLERMITGLVLYSKSTRTEEDEKEIDTAELVQSLTEPLNLTRRFTLHLADLPVLHTYTHKLKTVFEQLLQNAVQYNDQDDPQVWVGASVREKEVEFSIRDNGIGISEESLEKIFKIFYSLHPQGLQESVGLGLTLAKKIIQHVGGMIWVESTKGAGTNVTFTWPLSGQAKEK